MGMLGYRNQPDNNHLAMIPSELDNYPLIEQDGYQVVFEIFFVIVNLYIYILFVPAICLS